jgi:hypothetical protein|tara:strand:- start:526 stop:714 length:189 start_codon:yes stop_codon:yes gene_type:complete
VEVNIPMLLNGSPNEESGVTPLYKEGHSSSAEAAEKKLARNVSKRYTANTFRSFTRLLYINY